MEAKVKQFIVSHGLLSPRDRVVIAVSGGPDSMCLLYLLYRLKVELDLELHVVHINHHLRGSESDAEAEFVRYFAQGLGLQVTVLDIDVKGAHAKVRGSKQELARDLRYQALFQVLKAWQGNKLAVAHNAEDQAETILLHIIRGTGLEGLVGIPVRNGEIIRPLLSCGRTEIVAYLREHDIDYCVDSSNQLTDYSRNKLRLEVWPVLEAINPSVVKTVNRLGELAKIDEDFIATQVQSLWEQVVEQTEAGLLINTTAGDDLHPALFNRLCRRAWRHFMGHNKNLEHTHIKKIKSLLTGRTGAIIDLPAGVRVERTYKGLLWQLCQQDPSTCCEEEGFVRDVMLRLGEQQYVDWAGFTIIVEQGLLEQELQLADNQLLINPEEIELPFCIRTRRQGDRFRPQGTRGSKKLKDYLIDSKIPRRARGSLPLLADASGQVWWILGVRKGSSKKHVQAGCPYYLVTVTKN